MTTARLPGRALPLAVAVLAAVACVTLVVASCGKGTETRPAPPPSHTVLDTINTGGYVLCRVQVEPGVTRQELEAVGRAVVEEAKAGPPTRRIWVWLYDYAELVENGGPSLGWARLGPTQRDTEPGAYDEMILTLEMSDKDWSKRPTQQQVDVWARWQELYWGKSPRGERDDHDYATSETAREFAVTAVEVEAAVEVVDDWIPHRFGRIW